ncbi:MAG TPA: hypothetical protein VMZ91_11825 [Candidatus Paceibacterota bacterium]|nr:hypothetical protein [Candidatus Paceibacterota bacterium]
MRILYDCIGDLATVILEVARGWSPFCGDKERDIRDLLNNNFEKVNEYNTVDGSSNKKLDRIILYPSARNETHLHVYQGEKDHLHEILTFCENQDIDSSRGIGINLKEKHDKKYGKMQDKNIQALLEL